MELKKVALALAFMLSWHFMDVGEIMHSFGVNTVASNGIWHCDPNILYHMGDWGD